MSESRKLKRKIRLANKRIGGLKKCAAFIVFCLIMTFNIPASANTKAEALSNINDHLPAYFELNRGQVKNDALFVTYSSGYELEFRKKELVFTFPDREVERGLCLKKGKRIRMRIVGADSEAGVSGEERLDFTLKQFTGMDRNTSSFDIPTFSRIRYKGIYSDTDLLFYWQNRNLRFDIIVGPDTNPEDIRFEFTGLEGMPEIDVKGNLLLPGSNGKLSLGTPFVYQNGKGGRTRIECKYVLRGKEKNEVGFMLGDYNEGSPLIIDPEVEYINYWDFEGAGATEGDAVAVDDQGYVYVAGGTIGPGNFDAFIYKLDPNMQFVYAGRIGGSLLDMASGLAVDSQGNAIVAGITGSVDFPVGNAPSPQFQELTVYTKGFLTKISPQGEMVFSYYLGGDTIKILNIEGQDVSAIGENGETDFATKVAVDEGDAIYVTGRAITTDFPVTPGAFDESLDGLSNAFLAKLDPNGVPVYVTYLGGEVIDLGQSVYADASGNAFVSGITFSTQFPTTENAISRELRGPSDAFISEFNAAGEIVFSTYLGDAGNDMASDIAVNEAGIIFTAGQTDFQGGDSSAAESQANPPGAGGAEDQINPPAQPPENNGSEDQADLVDTQIFLSIIDPANVAINSYVAGGAGLDLLFGLALDSDGMVYLCGGTDSPDFPCEGLVEGAAAVPNPVRGYVIKMNPTDGTTSYCTYVGKGEMFDWAKDIAVDSQNNAYVTGISINQDASFYGSFLVRIRDENALPDDDSETQSP